MLSNTTLADKIIVLNDGVVIEVATHDALIQLGGVYAKLFNLQANKYI